MGYGNHDRHVLTVHEKTADNLAATGDDLELTIFEACTLKRVEARITTATVSTGDIVIKVDRTLGSDGTTRGDGDAGILYIPGAVVAGKVCYDDITLDLNPGDLLTFQVTTAAAGGGAAGNARYAAIVVPRDEVPANFTNMRDSDTAS